MPILDKDTVDFVPNFDETEKEPTVLPSRYPNLLVNGTTGIAVGMATNIPPHNLREVIDAVVKIIDNKVEEDRDTDIEELLAYRQGTGLPYRRHDSWNQPALMRLTVPDVAKIRVRAVYRYRTTAKRQEPYRGNRTSVHG